MSIKQRVDPMFEITILCKIAAESIATDEQGLWGSFVRNRLSFCHKQRKDIVVNFQVLKM